jgi:hypothetical protein
MNRLKVMEAYDRIKTAEALLVCAHSYAEECTETFLSTALFEILYLTGEAKELLETTDERTETKS